MFSVNPCLLLALLGACLSGGDRRQAQLPNPISFHLIVSCQPTFQLPRAPPDPQSYRRNAKRPIAIHDNDKNHNISHWMYSSTPSSASLDFDVDDPLEGFLETSTATRTADENQDSRKCCKRLHLQTLGPMSHSALRSDRDNPTQRKIGLLRCHNRRSRAMRMHN
jgi:hypothetical protein